MLHSIRMDWYCLVGRISPRKLVDIWYKIMYGRHIDLDNPKDIDEKVNWLKFNSDLTLWTRCADKAAVREYVREKGLGETLNEVYGVYDRVEDVDFDQLPGRFAIKSTNGGGGNAVLLVKSRDGFNEREARALMSGWLRHKVGRLFYEPHYSLIKPRLIAERYLDPNIGETSLVDIKINCFNGKAHSVFLCSDREFGRSVHYSVYDLDWNLHPEKVCPEFRTTKVYPRPRSFGDMVKYSEILSEGIPYVRVDWYEIEGKPVFSEMTFTPAGGFQHFYTREYLEELGGQLQL